ncbi:hypothetical protein MPTK1_7g00480 [Marchantia polymorpha subsp. ruderalis]|uniref:Uncharacterized protein n=1 Tax=Marchantia polymorpha subsp. ruderalis TaxID=1480154 RepID=A0AAF6BUR7_MARPO|nr:hypothetical protein Mp_7g00480 [Marchantia polymorpha subsp. ruderalis]
MIVQEAGMAVGWPLGLGHDTTGWPLGLRLRLTQEDLQWPREPHLDDSPSYSTNSSSLDTESTRSFFQDKSISLGALIGLPINQFAAASNGANHNHNHSHGHSQQAQRRARNGNNMLRVFPASTSSGSRCGSEHGHKSRSSHGSNRPQQASKGAASAAWALLSVLSCARVPSGATEATAATGGSRSSKSSSAASSVSSRFRSSEHSTSNPPAAAETARPGAGGGAGAQFACRTSPANKLYDNITFEEEAADHDESHSSEWNPLFASSSLENVEDEDDLDRDAAVPESLQHMQSLMRSHSSYSDSTQASDWSSASESCDLRHSKPSPLARHDLSSQFGKHSALHMLISRMVCCRSTPTVDT